ncbi:MAG: hypothetical protein RBS08_00520 [Bdellovibrionales bacterium]|nr:hypothetical protein [Bdellovibrionales bacterium]
MQDQKSTAGSRTGDIPFDFDRAVQRARQDYPAETRNITFIDIDRPDAQQQYAGWLAQLSPKARVRATQCGVPKLESDTGAFAMGFEGKVVVAVHGQQPQSWRVPEIPQGRWMQYVFDHELGHAVVKGGMYNGILNPPPNFKESIADSFAVLRGLRNGTLQREEIRILADHRMEDFMRRQGLPQQHLTTMALDALVINPKQTDFMSLSHAEIKSVAHAHAKAFSNDSKTNLALISSKFCWDGEKSDVEKLHTHVKRLTDLAEQAPADSSRFYIALRALKTPLAEKAVSHYISAEAWQEKLQKLESRAPHRDVGAVAAAQKPAVTAETAAAGIVARVKQHFTKLRI